MFTAVKKLSNVLCLVVLCITLSATAMAKGTVSKDFPVSYRDNQLAEGVAHAIRMYPWYDIFDWVEGTVQNGGVTLTGESDQCSILNSHPTEPGSVCTSPDSPENYRNTGGAEGIRLLAGGARVADIGSSNPETPMGYRIARAVRNPLGCRR